MIWVVAIKRIFNLHSIDFDYFLLFPFDDELADMRVSIVSSLRLLTEAWEKTPERKLVAAPDQPDIPSTFVPLLLPLVLMALFTRVLSGCKKLLLPVNKASDKAWTAVEAVDVGRMDVAVRVAAA